MGIFHWPSSSPWLAPPKVAGNTLCYWNNFVSKWLGVLHDLGLGFYTDLFWFLFTTAVSVPKELFDLIFRTKHCKNYRSLALISSPNLKTYLSTSPSKNSSHPSNNWLLSSLVRSNKGSSKSPQVLMNRPEVTLRWLPPYRALSQTIPLLPFFITTGISLFYTRPRY